MCQEFGISTYEIVEVYFSTILGILEEIKFLRLEIFTTFSRLNQSTHSKFLKIYKKKKKKKKKYFIFIILFKILNFYLFIFYKINQIINLKYYFKEKFLENFKDLLSHIFEQKP